MGVQFGGKVGVGVGAGVSVGAAIERRPTTSSVKEQEGQALPIYILDFPCWMVRRGGELDRASCPLYGPLATILADFILSRRAILAKITV